METEHARQLIPDYVLGLLSTEERQQVERHTQGCAACREALRRERQLETLVRGAVSQAVETGPRPTAGRFRALRPVSPAHTALRHRLYRQLAPAALVMALLVLALFVQLNGSGSAAPAFAQTRWAATLVAATNAAATSAATPVETTTSTRAAPLATPRATLASAETVPAAPVPPPALTADH
jgi:anti-sigma factor RsiW